MSTIEYWDLDKPAIAQAFVARSSAIVGSAKRIVAHGSRLAALKPADLASSQTLAS